MLKDIFELLTEAKTEEEKKQKLFDYGLDVNEQEEADVNYDYWNFDEEELEEDDYYAEDDD